MNKRPGESFLGPQYLLPLLAAGMAAFTGLVSANPTGDVVLMARTVENAGTMNAPNGTAAPNPLHPRPCGGVVAEGLKKQMPSINNSVPSSGSSNPAIHRDWK